MDKFDYEYDDGFLPLNREEMEMKGWEQPDFVYVIGDAYVDHSSFGHAIISRILELYGYKVAIISQPDWKNPASIDIYGRPRLAYLVSAGNMDSMVNHYSVSKRKREHDSYTPGGIMGKRPDYATVVYCNLIRRKYKDIPIIIGGIEASLRRLAHYDYWSNHIKHSVLIDSQADILIYGMGEKAIVEIAEALDSGIGAKDICFVEGTAYRTTSLENAYDYIELPSYDELKADKLSYAKSFKIQYENTDHYTAKTLVEKYNDHMYVVQNKPAAPLTEHEMDRVYSLPYKRTYHPSYEALGGVPAISEV
ncbi:MAG: YgiQ family radical SAM protein, partial [Clostridium sp.]|nr:YgiQ family radical SAM protein [Clostridium sp.]